MSNTENHYFQGKAKWVRVHNPDQYNNWKMDLYLTDESYKKLLDLKESKDGVSGILNVIKKDDDGYYTSFKRPASKLMRGKTVGFAPPEVLDKDGVTPLRDTVIGNGSDVTVKIQVYTYNKPAGGKGRATRLEAIKVDNLIPYGGKKDMDDEMFRQTKGLDEQPEQPLW